jgi:uncharacterized protein YidB (DUF937 family)
MGLLDDILGSAVPGGNLAKPVMIAAAALLGARAIGGGGLGNLLGGGASTSPTPPGAPAPASGQPAPRQAQGGLLGGLSGLLQSFQQSGHGDIINSWIGPGQNQPITSDQLHQALGPQAVDNLSRLTGVAAPDLISELSRMLPGIIDRLTPQGRLPNQAEMAHW